MSLLLALAAFPLAKETHLCRLLKEYSFCTQFGPDKCLTIFGSAYVLVCQGTIYTLPNSHPMGIDQLHQLCFCIFIDKTTHL